MKTCVIAFTGLLIGGIAAADNLQDVDEMLCSTSQVLICFVEGDCVSAMPWEIKVPQFVVIDTKKKTISTTKASNENRSTPIANVSRTEGQIYMQGIEGGRAFSFVIDEETGRITAAISRNGLSVTVFGACTDTDI